MGESKDWGTGLPLKASLLGKMSKLEVHHIFPKSRLYKHRNKYLRPEVNAVGNFCFLTKDTNLDISNRLPEEYFPEVEEKHPGSLTTQWIPQDPNLWKIENYREFLEARKGLLAEETNKRMAELLHGELNWLDGPIVTPTIRTINVGIETEAEEKELMEVNKWVEDQNLHKGIISYDFTDVESGEQKAIFDLAWPDGIQEELSQPVALMLNEQNEVLSFASKAGYRCFTNVNDFKKYINSEILKEELFTY